MVNVWDRWYYLDENHDLKPCTCEADMMFSNGDHRRFVKLDATAHGEVSTVFLQLDHALGSTSPVLYETLVFGGKLDGDGERYHTRSEAEAGHARYVRKVTRSQFDEDFMKKYRQERAAARTARG